MDKQLDFVWIFVMKESFFYKAGIFNELEWSIKSVQKNFQGDARCWVVGDKPNFEVNHIPVERFTEKHKQPRHMDILRKFEAIHDSEIGDEFVLMYDDMFIMQPTTEEELRTVYGRATVTDPEEYIKTRNGTSPYKRLWLATYDYIVAYRHSLGLLCYDWETHLPRILDKKRLKMLIDKYNLTKVPKILTSLYQAHFAGKTLLMDEGLQSDLWAHTPGMNFSDIFTKKYLNIYDNVIVTEFVDEIKAHLS